MATTYDPALGYEIAKKPKSGVFSRVMNSIIASRQREANRLVMQHLRTYDADTLRKIGYSEEQITEIFGAKDRS